jgi:hypothetical protein
LTIAQKNHHFSRIFMSFYTKNKSLSYILIFLGRIDLNGSL